MCPTIKLMQKKPKLTALARLSLIGMWVVLSSTTLSLLFSSLLSNDSLLSMEYQPSDQPSQLPSLFYYSLFAQQPPEGMVLEESVTMKEGRAAQLRAYLEWQKSPMATEAEAFIRISDKYGLNWLLLPAIAGKESTFGKQIPTNSFNAFGWGVFGDQVLRYESWEQAIEAVAAGLKRYAENGRTTVELIEPAYCPPSFGSHHAWRDGVNYFMWEIAEFPDFTTKFVR